MTHKGAPKIVYTEEQITAFIDIARVKGIAYTIRELGYPTYATATYWLEAREVEVPKSLITQLAVAHKTMYTVEEKLIPARALLDSITNKMMEGNLSARDAIDLASAYKKTIETIQLLEGKATSITETVSQDDNMRKLLDEMHKKNAEIEGKKVEAEFSIVDHEYDPATNRDE